MGFLIGIALSYSHIVYISLVSLNALLPLDHTLGQPPCTLPWGKREGVSNLEDEIRVGKLRYLR